MSESLAETATRVNFYLEQFLTAPDDGETRLIDAMRYAALKTGKAFRAFLCLEAARLTGAASPQAERVAAAIEAVHCYSLIHDDLPAMDNDDIRRGQPSLHKAYGEATALLAGTGLLTLAFEIIADEATHSQAAVRVRLISELAQAVGTRGMLGGQMLDIQSVETTPDIAALARRHSMKTGALIRYAVRAGALLGGSDDQKLVSLTEYANALGLAYQIADDVMDVEGTDDNTGKTQGKDAAQGKETFASLLGVVEARHQARYLVTQAVEHLAVFGEAADVLRDAAAFVIEREN